MTVNSVTPIVENGRSGTRRPVPVALATRGSALTHKGNILSSWYISRCPACLTHRRHNKDGVRRCPCGQVYRVVVGSSVGAEVEAA